MQRQTLCKEDHFRLLTLLEQMDEKEIQDGTKILYRLVEELLGSNFIDFVDSTAKEIVNTKL